MDPRGEQAEPPRDVQGVSHRLPEVRLRAERLAGRDHRTVVLEHHDLSENRTFIPARKRSCLKAVFYTCLWFSSWGGCLPLGMGGCMPLGLGVSASCGVYTSGCRGWTPPGRHTHLGRPPRQTPLDRDSLDRHSLQADSPLGRHLLGSHPRGRHPLGRQPSETATEAGSTHLTGNSVEYELLLSDSSYWTSLTMSEDGGGGAGAVQWGPCWTDFNMSSGFGVLYNGTGIFCGEIRPGPCTEGTRVGTQTMISSEQNDRQTWLKTLPSHNFVDRP